MFNFVNFPLVIKALFLTDTRVLHVSRADISFINVYPIEIWNIQLVVSTAFYVCFFFFYFFFYFFWLKQKHF